MLFNWCCSFNIFNAEKSVGGHIKKSITSSLFNRIILHLAIRCRSFKQINLKNIKLKFQTDAEKTVKNFRGATLFAALYTLLKAKTHRQTRECTQNLCLEWGGGAGVRFLYHKYVSTHILTVNVFSLPSKLPTYMHII